MNKRALMLTAATAAVLSGQAYGQTCATATSTTSPQLCDITTEIQSPLYTGAPASGVTSPQGNLGNITIDTNGELVIGTSPPTGPALTMNSGTAKAPTIVTNTTNITYVNVNYAVGVLMEEASQPTSASGYGKAENWVGEFVNSTGTINLTGSGLNKNGILIGGAAFAGTGGTTTNASTGLYANIATVGSSSVPTTLGVFTGATGVAPTGNTTPVAIDLESGSTLEVQGTNSYGINLLGPTYTTNDSNVTTPSGGASLIGDIDVGGAITMTPTTVGTLTTGQQNVAINIAGWMQSAAQPNNPALAGTAYAGEPYAMIGNINIYSGANVSSEGEAAQGIVILGAVKGSIINSGEIDTYGTTAPSTAANADDAEGGSAVVIANNLSGGIYNNGPTSTNGATSPGVISMIGNAWTVDISPSANPNSVFVPVTIGTYAADADYPNQFSIVNRGNITAASEDANVSNVDINIAGANATDTVTLAGGIFNSGTMSSTATTNIDATGPVTATAINIGDYVTVGQGVDPTFSMTKYSLINTNETGGGTISASITGTNPGTAKAIYIDTSQNAGGGLQNIFNSGTISASATTTTTTIATLSAYAIDDNSGTLTTITNEGTISATATTLDNNAQIAIAIDVANNTTTPVTVTDQATATTSAIINGDIDFGTKPGTLTVTGVSLADVANVTGDISFYNSTSKNDTITINNFGTVTGEINEVETGSVNIAINDDGKLNLLTTLPTNIDSTVSTTVVAGKPLSVGTLTVASGGALQESLSQAYNVAAFPGVSVINAQSATFGNVTDNIQPLQISFGGYVATPASGGAARFVLVSTPKGAVSISSTELAALETSIQTNQSNAIPFLFTGSLCTYNIATASSSEKCSGIEPVSSDDSEIVLNLTPKTAQALGLTGYAREIFKYANEALVNDNSLGAAMITDITNSPQAQAAYASFAPDVSGATRATAISLTDSATNIVAARQRELRMYVGQEGDTTLWGQQFAERLSQGDTPNGLTGYNDSGFGFVLGLDEGDPVDGRYGGAFTFFGGGMSQKEPTQAKTEQEYYLLTAYTDWRGKGLFVDTQATVGYGNLKGKRYLVLTDEDTGATLSREADGNRPTELLAGGITTGGIFNAGGTVLMPQVSVDGLTMREEGYTENNGGEGFDLHVQPYYANSLRAFIGGDIRQDVNFGDFYLQPDLRAGYRYDFVNGSVKLKANFASVSTINNEPLDQFTIQGPDPGHGNIVLGGGLATTTGAWSIGINYDYIRGNQGPTEQSGLLTLVGRI